MYNFKNRLVFLLFSPLSVIRVIAGFLRARVLIAVTTSVFIGFGANTAHAELTDDNFQYLPRIETPGCDGWQDTFSKYGGRALNAATIVNPVRIAVEFGMAGGDPAKFLEDFKKDWDEAKTFVGDSTEFALENNPGNFLFYATRLLPDGDVRRFFVSGQQLVGSIGRSLTEGSLDTLERDLVEVTGDIWQVVRNIDDPETFFEEYGKLHQKWTPLGAMTLMFTEDSFEEGAKRAAGNLFRQVEIVTTYYFKTGTMGQVVKKASALKKLHAAGKLNRANAKLIANSLKGLDLARAAPKDVVKHLVMKQVFAQAISTGQSLVELASPGDKSAMAMYVRAMLAQFALGEHPQPNHPFFTDTVVRPVGVTWGGDDYESDSNRQMSNWHPLVEDGSDCISLGDTFLGRRGGVDSLKAVCGKTVGGVSAGYGAWWARPVDYVPVWNDSCSGGEHDRSIWLPKCPPGFLGLGVVYGHEGSLKPLPNRIACLRDDPRLLVLTDGVSAGLKFETDDQGSGAKLDVTIYNRNVRGMNLSWAVTGYPGEDQQYLASLSVPVLAGPLDLAAAFGGTPEEREREARALARAIGLGGSADTALTFTAAMLVGEYSHQPVENAWHVGRIVDESGNLRWANDAGASWNLQLQGGVLATGPDNPYYQYGQPQNREFRLVMVDGQLGYEFNDALYMKHLTMASLLGEYRHEPAQNEWHSGRILEANGQLYWANDARAQWVLAADLANRVLNTGPDNPYYQYGQPQNREFTVVMENGQVAGFNFNDEYFRRQ